jgi:hypothetical protein
VPQEVGCLEPQHQSLLVLLSLYLHQLGFQLWGGTAAVSAGTVATWAAIGTAVGGGVGGTKEVIKTRRINKEFKGDFGI